MKPARHIKPNPADPTWTFPYASRACIENIERYMALCGSRHFTFANMRGVKTHVLPKSRKNKIPWESVPPHFRHRCEELFNRKVAIERAKGIPGWPSEGKIRSIRMNCANAGRHFFNGESYARYKRYLRMRNMWLRWLDWKAKNERASLLAARGPEAHGQLEIE